MKKTILCTVIGSVFSLNASAAILNVEGEIQVNGTTALATVNLDDYMAPSGTVQNYTALGYECSYKNGPDEPICGNSTKTITITTDKTSFYREEEEERSPSGNSTISTFTRNGTMNTEVGESRSWGSESHWEEEYWVNAAGDRIIINGMTAYDGLQYQECDDQGCGELITWHPDLDNGDKKMGGQIETQFINVYTWDQSWTSVELTARNYNSIVMGVPSASLWKTTNFDNSSESWKEIDGERVPDDSPSFHEGSSNGVYNDTLTVIGKIDAYNGYNDCIAIERKGDYKIQCANVGVVYFTEGNKWGGGFNSGYKEWMLTK